MYLFLGHFPPYNWDITTMTMLIKLQNRINRIRSWKKQWKLPLFHPTKKMLQHQSKPLGRNEHSNWATGTNKWHSGAVKAPGRLRHMHTFAQTHHYTHTSSFTSVILHLCGCSGGSLISFPHFLQCQRSEVRGRATVTLGSDDICSLRLP